MAIKMENKVIKHEQEHYIQDITNYESKLTKEQYTKLKKEAKEYLQSDKMDRRFRM